MGGREGEDEAKIRQKVIEKVINEWVGQDGERKRNIKERNKTESSYIRLCYTHRF